MFIIMFGSTTICISAIIPMSILYIVYIYIHVYIYISIYICIYGMPLCMSYKYLSVEPYILSVVFSL